MFKYSFILIASLLSLGVANCSSKTPEALDQDVASTKTAETLYSEATEAMNDGDYSVAIPLFEKVEQEYPYSKLASKSQLMAALSAYESDQYARAIIGLDRFIELYPGNEQVDYAYYLKALTYYEQISDVSRDQEMTQLALQSFDTLINRFPESQYTRDAKLKKDLTLDHLAGKEMEIGRYYLKRNQMNAAINRFQNVVKTYETTTHVAEALHRLVEAYTILGLNQEAIKIAAVLGHNYPGSKWYEDSYKILDAKSRQEVLEGRSYWNRTVDKLFDGE